MNQIPNGVKCNGCPCLSWERRMIPECKLGMGQITSGFIGPHVFKSEKCIQENPVIISRKDINNTINILDEK